MALPEQNAAVGYAALSKQTSKNVPVTPAIYTPYYKQTMSTNNNLIQDDPVFGNRFKHLQNLQGVRSHKGSITVMAEPTTAAYWMDMLATHLSVSGGGPYTHVYGPSNTTDPNYYTLDISLGTQVVRYWGIQASKLSIDWQNQRMQFGFDLSGLGSFHGREIGVISTVTLTLKTDYDPSPSTGLVAGDLVQVVKADGSSSLNTTVSSVTNGTTVVLADSAASFAAGDMIVLRPATPSLSLLTPFIWGKTNFNFAATASAALSGAQTRLEPETSLVITNDFNNDSGEARSGGLDPDSLIRTQYDADLKIKKYFSTTDEIKYWNALTKRAFVMRAYSGATNQHEFRVTLNNINTMTDEIPTDSGSTIYHSIEYAATYDSSDSQAMALTVIDEVATV